MPPLTFTIGGQLSLSAILTCTSISHLCCGALSISPLKRARRSKGWGCNTGSAAGALARLEYVDLLVVMGMIPEIDIWRTAQLMIEQYGEHAELEAAQRADREIDKGDPSAERIWVRVGKAIKHLMENKPNESLN